MKKKKKKREEGKKHFLFPMQEMGVKTPEVSSFNK
jgi:hypothetical protein